MAVSKKLAHELALVMRSLRPILPEQEYKSKVLQLANAMASDRGNFDYDEFLKECGIR